MIPVIDENGSAEAGTSPSLGSNNTSKATVANGRDRNTAPGDAARARRRGGKFDPRQAFSGSECRVLTLAPLLKHLRAEGKRQELLSFDCRGSDDDWRRHGHDSAAAHANDQEAAVRDVIAACEASSLQGVAIQIGDLLARIELLVDGVEPSNKYTFQGEVRRIRRLVYSILRCVVRNINCSMDDVVDSSFFERHMDPWASSEDAEG